MFIRLKLPPDSWVRRHWLAVVFVFAALMTTKLVDVQGQTIEKQRWLIKALSRDSIEMYRLKAREQQKGEGKTEQKREQTCEDADKHPPKRHEDPPQEATPRAVPLEDPVRAVKRI